jgi:hypothetical protein
MPAALALLAALLLLPLAGAWSWLHDGHPGGWLLAYPGFSLIAFFAYWRDKRTPNAVRGERQSRACTCSSCSAAGRALSLPSGCSATRPANSVSCCHSRGIVLLHRHFWLDHLGGGFLFAALARQLAAEPAFQSRPWLRAKASAR